MLYPVIDIGSNTVKLAVLDEEKIFSSVPVLFKAVPLNLRSKIENGILSDTAVKELGELMVTFRDMAARLTSTPPVAFATASLRGVENAEDVLVHVLRVSGIEVEIVSGEDEAYYSFLGARGSHRVRSGVVVDLGGGSTEILAFRGDRVEKAVSLPFGCLTLFHRFFERNDQYELCCDYILRTVRAMAPAIPGNSILLTGGSAKAVLKYKNFLEDKRTFTLGTRQMRAVRKHYKVGGEKERERIASVLKDRFRLIPPAVAVFLQITRYYKKEQVTVCRGGVREGYLYHRLQKLKKI